MPQTQILRRPSQYMNFEKAMRNQTGLTHFESVVNFPSIAVQLKPGDPSRAFTEGDRRWLSMLGTVYPDDRHFVVSRYVSDTGLCTHSHHD